MNIEYVGRHYQVDDDLRQFAEDKLQKVSKFLDEPVEIRITLENSKHRQIADLHISHRHGVLQATEETDQMYDSLNLAVDKVEKQARRSHKKFVSSRRRADRASQNGHRWPVNVLESASFGAAEGPRIIKSSHLQIKPMSIDEAALQLKTSKNEFVVFRNSVTEKVNVLYRRKDDNYGLITPEL
jgi:putative sigma-54 modulation protein